MNPKITSLHPKSMVRVADAERRKRTRAWEQESGSTEAPSMEA
jgi:hypothetical protein